MKDRIAGQVVDRVEVGDLTDTDGILGELRKLYRAARLGEIAPSDATKLTYILKVMSEVMTLRELEARLDCLETGRTITPRLPVNAHYQDPAESH